MPINVPGDHRKSDELIEGETIRCPTCRAENRAIARFCHACGQVLPRRQPREIPHPRRQHAARKKGWTGAQIALVGALAIALMITCCVWVWLAYKWPGAVCPG